MSDPHKQDHPLSIISYQPLNIIFAYIICKEKVKKKKKHANK